MPRYDFRCPHGHVTEHVIPMADTLPGSLPCECGEEAVRLFEAPAAIHFKGRGFYATDVKGAQQRKRRPNPGDSLRMGHDPQAAAIARSL